MRFIYLLFVAVFHFSLHEYTRIYFSFLLLTVIESESESCSVVPDSWRPYGLQSSWISPGQNTGVGNLSLLQGIVPTQGLNPDLPQCRQNLYQLSHRGSPGTLEWVAYPFSSRSFRPRNRTGVSCIAGGFFYQLSYQGLLTKILPFPPVFDCIVNKTATNVLTCIFWCSQVCISQEWNFWVSRYKYSTFVYSVRLFPKSVVSLSL